MFSTDLVRSVHPTVSFAFAFSLVRCCWSACNNSSTTYERVSVSDNRRYPEVVCAVLQNNDDEKSTKTYAELGEWVGGL